MTTSLIIAGLAMGLYLVFHLWYGGKTKPLTDDERNRYLSALAQFANNDHSQQALREVSQLVAADDGREFVMQNLARYRPKAAYPPGMDFDDDPRHADQRYAKGIVWPLLKRANMMVFIGRRRGTSIEPEGADAWHYVAMVRYRSKRDFLKFALEIEKKGVVIHKWAALEKTHVFPVQPLISLVMVRWTVASVLALLATGVATLVTL